VYQPPAFREERLDVMHALIRAHPLGTLVTLGSGGLVANPIPFLLDDSRGEFGVLQGHLARSNGQWRDFDPAIEALVVFQGVESYITPVLVRDQAADRESCADLELRDCAGFRAAHRDRGPGLAGGAGCCPDVAA
jgi:predicted FMN-binding regulatory protein PaiB